MPRGGLDENDNAIVRLANQIIADAFRQGASDIHIEPYGEKRETLVRFRVDGNCFEYMKIPQSYRRAIVSRLKIMAQSRHCGATETPGRKNQIQDWSKTGKSNFASRPYQPRGITKTW